MQASCRRQTCGSSAQLPYPVRQENKSARQCNRFAAFHDLIEICLLDVLVASVYIICRISILTEPSYMAVMFAGHQVKNAYRLCSVCRQGSSQASQGQRHCHCQPENIFAHVPCGLGQRVPYSRRQERHGSGLSDSSG